MLNNYPAMENKYSDKGGLPLSEGDAVQLMHLEQGAHRLLYKYIGSKAYVVQLALPTARHPQALVEFETIDSEDMTGVIWWVCTKWVKLIKNK